MTSEIFAQAKSHHEAGDWDLAESLYREALTDELEAFKAYNNLGNVLEQQGKLQEAIEAYQSGIELAPECFLLHYNLARALQMAGHLGPALFSYMKALSIDPLSAETHYNVGNLLSEQGRTKSALEAYRRAIECDPTFREAHSNSGSVHYELREFELAEQSYRRALELDPTTAVEHFHLARCLAAQHRFDEAIQSFQTSLQLNPLDSSTHAQLFALLQNIGRDFEAEQAYAVWKQALPDDPVAEHVWASHTGVNVPERATAGYLQAIFDDFSTDFDAVLAKLQYCAPRLLVDQLLQHHPSASRSLDILDAGCGTGLCGPLLRPLAQNLEGVDLSLGMLEKARLRNVYDNLFQQDLNDFLLERPNQYDVVIAADTLIYFGELHTPLAAIATALRPGGLAVFNLESLIESNGQNYVLHRSGRYAHALEFVGLMLQRTGFEIVLLAEDTVRFEAAQRVLSHIVIARHPRAFPTGPQR
jgi:predicted TPR repeat methyltransferase